MDGTAVQKVSIAAEKLLGRGDQESVRQMISRLQELLLQGPTPEQGGPLETDPDILAAAVKIQMRKMHEQTLIGKAVAERMCGLYRENFINDVEGMCGSQLTPEERETVAAKFNIVLCYWLRTAAELIQKETADYYDLEAVRGG